MSTHYDCPDCGALTGEVCFRRDIGGGTCPGRRTHEHHVHCDDDGWDHPGPCVVEEGPFCPRCGASTDPEWFCSEGYCPTCCVETDEERG